VQTVVYVGILASHLGGKCIQVRLGLRRRDICLEAADHPGIPRVSVVEPRIALDAAAPSSWAPKLLASRTARYRGFRRGHADYAVEQAVEANRFANDGGVRSESRLPSGIAEHSVRAGSRMQVIVFVEETPQAGSTPRMSK